MAISERLAVRCFSDDLNPPLFGTYCLLSRISLQPLSLYSHVAYHFASSSLFISPRRRSASPRRALLPLPSVARHARTRRLSFSTLDISRSIHSFDLRGQPHQPRVPLRLRERYIAAPHPPNSPANSLGLTTVRGVNLGGWLVLEVLSRRAFVSSHLDAPL